jgi:TRAP-type C4-dicarboxylate transport system permease small subunit
MTADLSTPEQQSGPITRGLDLLASACRWVAMAGLVIITLVQGWQVFGRFVLNDSPGWTEPVSVFFMALTVMLAGAVGVREGTHFAFTSLIDAAPLALKNWLQLINHILLGALMVAVCWWTGQILLANLDVLMPGAPLPAGLRYIPVALGAGLMGVFALERVVRAARALGGLKA